MARKLIAAAVFLVGFPALCVLLLATYEAQATRYMVQLHGVEFPTPTLNFLSGQGGLPVIVAGFVAAIFGFGIYDVALLFMDPSFSRSYRYDAILPNAHPTGYVFLRLRRYLLIPVFLAVSYFVVYYMYREPKPEVAPHLIAFPVALAVSRRPLNWSLGGWWDFILRIIENSRHANR